MTEFSPWEPPDSEETEQELVEYSVRTKFPDDPEVAALWEAFASWWPGAADLMGMSSTLWVAYKLCKRIKQVGEWVANRVSQGAEHAARLEHQRAQTDDIRVDTDHKKINATRDLIDIMKEIHASSDPEARAMMLAALKTRHPEVGSQLDDLMCTYDKLRLNGFEVAFKGMPKGVFNLKMAVDSKAVGQAVELGIAEESDEAFPVKIQTGRSESNLSGSLKAKSGLSGNLTAKSGGSGSISGVVGTKGVGSAKSDPVVAEPKDIASATEVSAPNVIYTEPGTGEGRGQGKAPEVRVGSPKRDEAEGGAAEPGAVVRATAPAGRANAN